MKVTIGEYADWLSYDMDLQTGEEHLELNSKPVDPDSEEGKFAIGIIKGAIGIRLIKQIKDKS